MKKSIVSKSTMILMLVLIFGISLIAGIFKIFHLSTNNFLIDITAIFTILFCIICFVDVIKSDLTKKLKIILSMIIIFIPFFGSATYTLFIKK